MPTYSAKTRPPPEKLLPSLHSKLRKLLLRSASANITSQDPLVKAIYLGNLVTTWAKGEGCLDRPAIALWKNLLQGRGSIRMTVVVTPGGLKAETREHGLTEYWNNRLTWCGVPPDFPKLFCWIYRHETRKLKQELRCHAVICNNKEDPKILAEALRYRLAESLFDFRKEKLQRQNARLSSMSLGGIGAAVNGYTYSPDNSQSINNYRRERQSPSKLSIIEESTEEEDLYSPTLRATYEQVMHYLEMRSQGLYKSSLPSNSLSSSLPSSEATSEISDSAESSEDETLSTTASTASPTTSSSQSTDSTTNEQIQMCLNLSNDHQRLIYEEICYDI